MRSVPDFVTDSEMVIAAAFWTGVVAAMMSLALLFAVGALRMRAARAARRRENLRASWRPVIAATLAGEPVSLPALAPRDLFEFLNFWIGLHGWLRGESEARLNEIARRLMLRMPARRLIERGSLRERVLAAATLGHLHDLGAFETMVDLARDRNVLLSLTAARALIRIDARAAISLLMPLIATRADWPTARVATLLRAVGPEHVTEPLAAAIRNAPPATAAALLRHVHCMAPEAAMPLVREVLAEARDERVLGACLGAARDPRLLPQVRALSRHARWHVRMRAATALGRFGANDDRARLIEMLGDAQWWVRYRAAQALTALPGMDTDALRSIQSSHSDRYARDILDQVIAERAAS